MNNKEKQYLCGLEHRVLVIENTLQTLLTLINSVPNRVIEIGPPWCTQCNIAPSSGHICQMKDCCQGRNPLDDEVSN